MQSKLPVSVVMAIFNGADVLSSSIDSILNQTFTDFELIIINDGSTDNTRHLLDAYAAKDQRIKVTHQDNQGLTRSLINGCSLASGDYITRMDAGDISYPDRFRLQAALLNSDPDLGMVYCGTDFYGPYGELLYNITRSSDPQIAHEQILHQKLGPCHSAVMMRKSVYIQAGGYRPEFYYSQDSDLWLRISQISKVCSTEETLVRYNYDLKGISANKKVIQYQFADLAHAAKDLRLQGKSDQQILDQAKLLIQNMMGDQVNTHKKQRKQSRDLAAHLYFLGSVSSNKFPQESCKYFSMALYHDPLNFKNMHKWILSLIKIFRTRSTTVSRKNIEVN